MEPKEEKIEKQVILPSGTEATEITYTNGHKVLLVTLSDGRIATIRELLAEDSEKAARIAGNSAEKASLALSTIATTINGQTVVIEDMAKMKMKDYNKIAEANAELNF